MLLLSLIGEQPIPNLLTIRQLNPDANLLVYTNRTEAVASRLRRLLSGAGDLKQDLLLPTPYRIEEVFGRIQTALSGSEEVVFNLTGGTKPMALAGYALAARLGHPVVYLQSEGGKSLLYRYNIKKGQPALESCQEIPPLISAADYLNAHLQGFTETGYSRERTGQLSKGGLFERAVCQALENRLDEVLVGVRPDGAADPIEIDLVLRMGNRVGIAELKTGKNIGKRALDQLKMAGESTYLGSYTTQFLIIAASGLDGKIDELARERRVEVICLPSYQPGQPLNPNDAERLAITISKKLSV